MGLVKFYHGTALPNNADRNPDVLYFVEGVGLYKGNILIADATDTIKIDQQIQDIIATLGKAVKFLGHSSVEIKDGGTEKPVIGGSTIETLAPGDVVFYDGKEYIWVSVETEEGTKIEQWELFGDEGSYATKSALEEFKDSLTSDNGFVVKKAEKAEHAEEATHATSADSANSATTAEEAKALILTDAVGSVTQPVYFKVDGTPEAITHTIESNVPANAKFTDTVTDIAETKGEGNAVTTIEVKDGQLTITKGATFAAASTVEQLSNDLNGVIDTLTWIKIPEESVE